MAKQQHGSSRAQSRPAPPTGKPSGKGSSGSTPTGSWQPSRVSASKGRGGPNRTLLFTIGALAVGVAIVVFVAIGQLGNRPSASSPANLVTPGILTPASIPVDGLTLGKADAPATIDLWGDFRCSACYQFTEMGTAQQINKELIATGQARQVWHDFTVIDLHDGTTASRDAANAARCAGDQNKFWLMHDWLYANQSATEDASAFTKDRLLAIGKAAGLDMAAFTPCVQNGTHNAEIAKEQASLPASVTGTPTLIVNGTAVPTSFDAVKAAVEAAAGGASGAPASSVASPQPSPSG